MKKSSENISIRVPFKMERHTKTHRSKSDPQFYDEVLNVLVFWFFYAYTPRSFELRNRKNRDVHRSTNQNLFIENTSIVQMAKGYLNNSVLIQNYYPPKEFSFYRQAHRDSGYSETVSYSTVYYFYKKLNDPKVMKDHPNFSFKTIASHLLNKKNLGIKADQLAQDYELLLTLKQQLKK